MTTVVKICNMALAHVGQPRISNISESNECDLFYEQVRDEELEGFDYYFGIARQSLAEKASNPLSKQWDYAYAIPSNLKTMIAITNEDARETDPKYPFIVEGATLYTNVVRAQAIYAADSDDPSLWSALFRDAVAYKLASRIAIPITQRADFARWAMEQYQGCVSRAQAHSIRCKAEVQTYTRQPPSQLFRSGIFDARWIGIEHAF